jgi:hypothetical protein
VGDYTCTYNPPLLPRGLPNNICLFEILRARKRQSEILRTRKGQSEGLSQSGQVRLITEGGENDTVNCPVHLSETRLARAVGTPGNSGETSANLAESQVHALEHRAVGHGGGITASNSVAHDEAGATTLTSTSAVVQLVQGASSTDYYESEASYTPRVNATQFAAAGCVVDTRPRE